jgi:hypothetical protein
MNLEQQQPRRDQFHGSPNHVGTSLYNSIACLQVNVRIVEQHADLA